ncbi:M20 family metallopeptidase [Glutamicibacter sp. NPDC087344]|uniref:M20 family metallopeptidase n=1 Tax=Glutamicibacter sp. NPDC087344 TaxID=3363994 RepID=UPI0038003221
MTETTATLDAVAIRTRIREALDVARERIIELNQAIGHDPELAFQEHRAAARVADLLESEGFTVTRGAYGLATALQADYGAGELVVAIAGEYDALPGVGHGCGHNVIAAAGVGAAIALKPVADELGIRVKFLGTPAEELGGGKILMLQRGAWDDATFSLMVHGGPDGQVPARGFRGQALEMIIAKFHGRTAHAAAAPQQGINAGDAVTLAQVAFGLLRQQLPKTVVLASYIAQAGGATNVIPDLGVLEVEMRGNTAQEWNDVRARARKALEGAALATGCTLELEYPELPYEPLDGDDDIAQIFDDMMVEELGYTLKVAPSDLAGGSTDMGNVSQYLPSIHPMIAFLGTEAYPHHVSFAQAAVSPAGDRAALDGALAMALTVATVAQDPAQRERLLAVQRERSPYTSAD